MRPEGEQRPVRRIAVHGEHPDLHPATQPPGDRLGLGEDDGVERRDLGQVVRHEPPASGDARVDGDDHDPPARDAAKLEHALALPRMPVVAREKRERGVDRGVGEGKAARERASPRASRMWRASRGSSRRRARHASWPGAGGPRGAPTARRRTRALEGPA